MNLKNYIWNKKSAKNKTEKKKKIINKIKETKKSKEEKVKHRNLNEASDKIWKTETGRINILKEGITVLTLLRQIVIMNTERTRSIL